MGLLPYLYTTVSLTLLIWFYFDAKLSKQNPSTPILGAYSLKRSSFYYLSAYFIYITFATFRYIYQGFGGTDAIAYKMHFMKAFTDLRYFLTNFQFEYGFGAIVWLVGQVTDDYRVMLFIWHTLTFIVLIKYLGLIVKEKRFIPVIMIVLFELFVQFNTLRQSISISLGLLVLVYLYKKMNGKAILLFLLASSMHFSSLILLPVMLIHFFKHYIPQKYIKIGLVTMVLGFTTASFISKGLLLSFMENNEKYWVYVKFNKGSIPLATLIIITVIFALAVINYEKLCQYNPFNEVLIWSLPVFYIAVTLQSALSILYRTLLIFTPIAFALVPPLLGIYSMPLRGIRNLKKSDIPKICVSLLIWFFVVYRIVYFYGISLNDIGVPYLNNLLR